MKLTSFNAGPLFAVLAGLVSGFAAPAATLLVSPSVVSNFYSGTISLKIAGLTNGETVLVEQFLDANGNGVIDSGEPLVQSLLLTDGRVSSIGGVRNSNIPGDDDLTTNGQISATVKFAQAPEFSRGSGAQIVRLSSPTGRFAAVQQLTTVTQSAAALKITGVVSSGGSPLPNAWVGLLVPLGKDNIYLAGATADSLGKFSLNVTNGTYQVIGFKPGYVGNFSTSPLVTVSGANTNVTVALAVANLTLSGSVIDATSALGIAGFQFFAESSSNDYTAFFSDAQGNFTSHVIAGKWKIEPSDSSALAGGYLRAQTKLSVTLSNSNLAGVTVPMTKGTALIYGQLKTDQNLPLAGVRLYAGDSANLLQSTAYTDANGNYLVPVSAGIWYLSVDGSSAGLPSSYTVQQIQANLVSGQTVQTNLVAQRATALLVGRAFDGNHNPINGGRMIAWAAGTQDNSAQLASDGSFVMPAKGGNWTLSLDSQTASSMNLVASQISMNVTDGINISNIVYVAPFASRTISGSVRTITNTPVVGLLVNAGAIINGTNYDANANTDAGGNFSFPVLPGQWYVTVDSQGLAQLGYGAVAGRSADTSSGNQTANFVVGGPPISAPTLSGAASLAGHTSEFSLNVAPGQNYTIQFSSDLSSTNWSTLYITNSASSPVMIVDPNATNASRFYRVLVGP